MAKIAQENYTKMMTESVKKFTKDEILTMKKLGLTNDQISQMGPDDNPFKDTGLAGRDDISSVIEFQQKFYEDLQLAYKKKLAAMDPADLELVRIADKKAQ